ncbi:hypothetical protein [Hymenobacter metallicola]|uniref:DUF1735 domain-containing protein n=1 Tax=Hymenobacter metallicola TaxID=2563114 RepID=A0A4Z0QK89_9BACT|nr:hypothetical protein [Hymenobacter metallicola]TGE29132.1 hypothetical protein E5K02_06665 [Hymenobacter metallicola]
MTMFRTLKIGITTALAATAGLLTSCLQAPDYPTAPQINFKELKVDRYNFGIGYTPVDSVRLTIDFTDGDGDLGLSITGDQEAPYNPTKPDGTYNRTTHNYFITPYKRTNPNSPFEAVATSSTGEYNSRFPPLFSADAKPGPLKGTLTLTTPFFLGTPFRPGDEVRFEVTIMDRALNESNKITTSSYIVEKP